jgi:hypothetical protein
MMNFSSFKNPTMSVITPRRASLIITGFLCTSETTHFNRRFSAIRSRKINYKISLPKKIGLVYAARKKGQMRI